jgi:hypothetical protein
MTLVPGLVLADRVVERLGDRVHLAVDDDLLGSVL